MTYELTIAAIIPETNDVKSFVFEPNEAISYSAGQYLTFIFYINNVELRRSYSIASSPLTGEPLQITFKRIPNGAVSRLLFDHYKAGDIMITTGAAGFFVLPPPEASISKLFFFAAGSGIVPVFSMIKTALQLQQCKKVILIYSSRSEKQAIFEKQLQQLQKDYAGFLTVEFLFSIAFDLRSARLNNLLLEQLIRRYQVIIEENSFYYLCGPLSYMRMIEFELRTAGVLAERIRKEHFDTSRPLRNNTPPDTSAHQVIVHINHQVYTLQVQYPVSILSEAKKQHIPIPYSCEAGKCGNCSALCLEGKVWTLYNEVLTEEDLRKGIVLTCNSFPVGGDVVLSL
jgi:ring-1,2-phenylacetyl-CoA epoxidase subunit PaaE